MKNIPTDLVLYNKLKEKVKASVKRWPSAYASGMLVKQYKEAMAKRNKPPYKSEPSKDGLTRWFAEKWVDIKTNKPCGKVHTPSYYPTCRPSKKVSDKTPITTQELTPKKKKQMIQQKQKAKDRIIKFDT